MGPTTPSPLGSGVRGWGRIFGGPALEEVNSRPELQHPLLLQLSLGPFSFQVQRGLQAFFMTQILGKSTWNGQGTYLLVVSA